jgi:hypothetical protein
MGRRVNRVPVRLHPKEAGPLPASEIRTILRGADELVGSGGRSLLARVLKGSKQKAVLEHGYDRSPAYGAMRELSIEEITKRIDWMIREGYFAVEYEYRLPVLVYTSSGWDIEKDIYADELIEKLDRKIYERTELEDIAWLSERHPQVLDLVAERIGRTGDPKYLPFLMRWKNKASRRVGRAIGRAIAAIEGGHR